VVRDVWVNAPAISCISTQLVALAYSLERSGLGSSAFHPRIDEGEFMKRFWTAPAVTLLAIGMLAGCNDYNNSIQYDTGATITSISPSALAAGTPATGTLTPCQGTTAAQNMPCFTLFVLANSANPFLTTSVVEWNGQKMFTTYIDATDLSAQIPYSLIAKPGTANVNTFQPQSGTGMNGLSNSLTFLIYGPANPYPTLTSIAPTSAAYCNPANSNCANVPITVNGTNFIPGSQNGGSIVTFTGLATYGIETTITLNSFSATQLKATIPGAYLCATDTPTINVINPPSAICLVNCPNLGGGDTNSPPPGQMATTQIFTVTGTAGTNSCPPQTIPTPLTAAEAPAVSRDGRYVAYPVTQNGSSQILQRDTCLGAAKGCITSTRTESAATNGAVGNADSRSASMTSDGRYVAFSSSASNLTENAPAGRQIYLRDNCIGASGTCKASTMLVSSDEQGNLAGTEAILPSISASGRFVAFLAVTGGQAPTTARANTGAATDSSVRQVFLRDTCLGAANCTPATKRISAQAVGGAIAEEAPAVSQDGRYVSYVSTENGSSQILLRDTCLGAGNSCVAATQIVSAAADGTLGNGDSHNAAMTPDGRYVTFSSAASNLIESAPSGRQVYLRDTCIAAASSCRPSTALASTDEDGKLSGTEAILPSLSTSGRFVAFLAVASNDAASAATSQANIIAAQSGALRQVFVRDTCLGAANCTPATTRISLQSGDPAADSAKPAGPTIAGLGKQIALVASKSATVYTPTVSVDESVVLAVPNETK
jgi:Tol biopolymer transport system component